jgi:hypothetical protein
MNIFKNTLIVLFCSILFSCSDNYSGNNDWKKENLKGRVKSTKITAFIATEKFGNVQLGDRVIKNIPYPDLLTEYSNDGKKEIEVLYDEILGGEKTVYKYQYNNNDNGYTVFLYNNFGDIFCRHVYKLNKEFYPKEVTRYDSSGVIIDKDFYKYYQNKKLTEALTYDSNGKLQILISYRYDSFGKLIHLSEFDSDSTSLGFYKYYYNENGDIIEQLNYNNEGLLDSKFRYQYKYDNNSNWIEKIHYDGDQIRIEEREIEYYL